jgi:hypothetical protein
MTTTPPDPNQLLMGGPAARTPSPPSVPHATDDADWELLKIMWHRLGWPPPVRDYADVERNPGGRTDTQRRRPRVVPPGRADALLYWSPTNIAKLPGDHFLLELWKQRQVLLGTALDQGIQDQAIAAQNDRDALNKLVQRAMNRAKSDENADRGSARHAISAKIDFGLQPGRLSDSLRADLDAYRHATRHFDMVLGEVFVVDDVHKMGGTLDRVCEYQGRYYIMDLKPPESGFSQDERAIQFAIYARAQAYNWNLAQHLMATDPKALPTARLRAELPQPLDQERAIMVHVPRGGTGRASTAWVDIAAGWEGFEHAIWQRRWQSRDYRESLVTPFEPTGPDRTVIDPGQRNGRPPGAHPAAPAGTPRGPITTAHAPALSGAASSPFLPAGTPGDPLDPDEAVKAALRAAPDGEALKAVWRRYKATWCTDYTTVYQERRDQLMHPGRPSTGGEAPSPG